MGKRRDAEFYRLVASTHLQVLKEELAINRCDPAFKRGVFALEAAASADAVDRSAGNRKKAAQLSARAYAGLELAAECMVKRGDGPFKDRHGAKEAATRDLGDARRRSRR